MIIIHMSNSDAANARVTVSVTTVSHTHLRPISGFLHLYSFSIIFLLNLICICAQTASA